MKKGLLLILWFFLSGMFISGLYAQNMTYSNLRDGNGIAVNVSLSAYEITSLNHKGEAMHEISLSGIFIPNDEGMPNLPRISRFVAVPNGAEVKISIKSMETKTLTNINIAPALRIQPISEEPVMDYVKNEKVYSTNDFYPQNPAAISEITNLRGVNVAVVGITPFQFNPVTKELIVIENIELEIEYIGGSTECYDTKYRSPWFDPILRNSILNYEVLDDIEYTGKSSKNGTGCEYLIVIPNREDFRPYAEQILDFRTKQGIYTKIITLGEMGVTTTAQMKTWFHNAYNTWDIPPVAVLLMADHNTNMALGIPAETVSHPDYGSCISDNQYSDVNGDYLPDMVFARMAAEDEAQIAVLVSKVLEYETQPCMDPYYYQNPITALGWQTERWFQICSEAVGGYWRNQGKTPVRINAIYSGSPGSVWSTNQNTSMVVNYFGPNGTGYIPATPAELGGWSGGLPSHVVTAVNNGAFALQHRDHGEENGWGEPAFKSSHISQFTNVGKMTYVFTINCLTGKFNHNPACFGEVFHRYTYNGQNAGCVGFLGPTEVSYSFVNDTYAWGMYDLFDPEFLPTYGPSYGPANGPYVGYSGNWMPAFGNVAGKYFLYQSDWPYSGVNYVRVITYQMFTAHSDVFLRLFTEVPQAITANHAEVTLAGNPNFLISANAGTLIALTAEIDGNLEILDVAIATGATQTMTIPSTLMPTTEINVVITGQNFLRYESIVTVVPASGPYIVPTGYEVVNKDVLTYISVNEEIAVTLKNVGIEATDLLNITIACDDPQLNIDNPNATCGGIQPDGTAIVHFNVTVANDIPDNKFFPLTVTVTEPGKSRVWESSLSLKAFAPVFLLEKVLINGVEGGALGAGTVATIFTVIKNKGGADAYNVKGNLEILSQYVEFACEEQTSTGQNLPAGESINIPFTVVTAPNMPLGHEANMNLLLNAQYGRSYTKDFIVTNSGSNAYCSSGSQNCNSSDKFTSVILHKTSTPSVLLINNTNTSCSSSGYQDYTSTIVELEPGEQYTIKVKCAYGSQQIGGWFDLNGNKQFDDNEKLITISYPTANAEVTQTFTVPADFTPGTYRFRLVTKYNGAPTECSNSSYGQTHDYSIFLPDLYPCVQNVVAVLGETSITVTWDAPATGTPIGYNIYRDGVKLNTALLTVKTFTEENILNGVYVYHVKAVYTGNKESLPEMSNVICNFTPCIAPVDLTVVIENNTAFLTWEDSPEMAGTLLGYNVFRNEVQINEELL
ncbi:MAG: C25 family cysteine peptidase, partial [Bacteroidales bacterium]|nr:C25 family cysteine peptidase [Bacteroidales bacterium]